MYKLINYQFKKESRTRNFLSIVIAIPTLLVMLLVALFYKWTEMKSFYGYIILLISLCLSTLIFLYAMILFDLKREKQFKWKNIWRIRSNVETFMKNVHQRDIELLIEILKSQGVNTRPKVLGVLRHYQCLLPRRMVSGAQSLLFVH